MNKQKSNVLIVGFVTSAIINVVMLFIIITTLFIFPPIKQQAFSDEIEFIRKDIRVIVKYNEYENKTLYLNTSQWYCKCAIFYGGNNTFPQDLYPPGAQIAFFFLEDLNETLADNYSDTIIRMNPIKDENGTMKMVVVAFFEGGYEKIVYYKERELFHYIDIGYDTRHYEIVELDLYGGDDE
jgi:hypothetical protein